MPQNKIKLVSKVLLKSLVVFLYPPLRFSAMRTPTLGLNLLNARQEVDGVPVPISWKETIYQEPVESLKKLLETWEKTNERLVSVV